MGPLLAVLTGEMCSLESAQGEKIAHGQSRDLLSLLVRANMASDPRERLSDADVLARRSKSRQHDHT
jgi:hypothetical protein